MQEIYRFNKDDFEENGCKKFSRELFSDTIRGWEKEFNKKYNPFFPNYVLANNSTMKLLENCFVLNEIEDFGMDGQFDIETNLIIDKYREREITYAIGSGINEDEPLFLVIDNKVSDGIVLLKYIPDNDDVNSEPQASVVEGEIKNIIILTPKN